MRAVQGRGILEQRGYPHGVLQQKEATLDRRSAVNDRPLLLPLPLLLLLQLWFRPPDSPVAIDEAVHAELQLGVGVEGEDVSAAEGAVLEARDAAPGRGKGGGEGRFFFTDFYLFL